MAPVQKNIRVIVIGGLKGSPFGQGGKAESIEAPTLNRDALNAQLAMRLAMPALPARALNPHAEKAVRPRR